MKYLVGVIVGQNRKRVGIGWYGLVDAANPAAAAEQAVSRHRDSKCFAVGEDILGVEVRDNDGTLIIDTSKGD